MFESSEKYELYTPRYSEGMFSFVGYNDDGKTAYLTLDHIISNLNVKKVEYLWDFINEENGYKGITKESCKKPIGIPDHD